MQRLELNGGSVTERDGVTVFALAPVTADYADAQIHDYTSRSDFNWRPPLQLQLRAKFSANKLCGTAGFGFWNAPAGDPTIKRPTLPQAVWFFYASEPNKLPFLSGKTGWFAAVINAATPRILPLLPLGLPLLLANQSSRLHKVTRPLINRCLQIDHAAVPHNMTDWHDYRIDWRPDHVTFLVDQSPILTTRFSPRGKLGFICWLDNQWMRLGIDGRLGAGVLPLETPQSMEIAALSITAS